VSDLEQLGVLVGSWVTEGHHPLLPDAVTGRAEYEWLEGGRFLVCRSSSDHPQVPDALSVTGVTDGRLTMHYFDSRGVFRVYSVVVAPGTWRFSLDAPDFSQRTTYTLGDDRDTVTSRGEYSRDGAAWEEDLALTFRRVR
jgi:hypothetical protein